MLAALLILLSSSLQPAMAEEIDWVEVESAKKGKWEPKGKILDLYLQAEIQRKKYNHDRATELYLEALEKQAGCGKLLQRLSWNLDEAGEYKDAIRAGEVLTRLFPEDTSLWSNLALFHINAEHPDKAIQAYKAIIDLDKDHRGAWAGIQSVLVGWGRLEEAQKESKLALDAGIKEEDVECYQVRITAAQEDLEAMDEHWEKCKESTNGDLRLEAEGWRALAKGDEKLAISRLTKAGPSNARAAKVKLAMKHLSGGRYDAAANLADAVNKSDNKRKKLSYFDASLVFAAARFAQGDYDVALSTLLADDRWGGDWRNNVKDGAMLPRRLALKGGGLTYQKDIAVRSMALIIATNSKLGNEKEAKRWNGEAIKAFGKQDMFVSALHGEYDGLGKKTEEEVEEKPK